MLIQVTNEDIANGKRDDCKHCPVALAVKRVLKEDYYCAVDGKYISIYQLNGRFLQNHYTSVIVLRFITMFDTGRNVEPFEFELGIDLLYLRT